MKGSPKSGAEENTFIKAYEELEKSGKTPMRGPEAYPLLEIVHGPKQGAWFTVAYQKEITLGRASTNSIVLEDNSVSRSHSVLQSSGNHYTLRDIGSRNGTFLNNKKIQEEVPVDHKDIIKIGIYTLRFLQEPTEELYELEAKEEHTPPVEPQTQIGLLPEDEAAQGESMEEVQEAPEPEGAPVDEFIEDTSKQDLNQLGAQQEAPKAKAGSKGLRNLFKLLVILLTIGALSYLAYYLGAFNKLRAYLSKPPAKVAAKVDKKTPEAPKLPEKKETPPPPVAQEVSVVLEADALPIPAKVSFKGKELGLTPFKINVPVTLGQAQEVSAEFFLEGLDEKWVEKANIQPQKAEEVLSLKFQPKWGTFKVVSLPKNSELYLEAAFAAFPNQPKSYKLSSLTLGTPIYIPYGKYHAEIRVLETPTGAQAPVPTPKFKRDFEINANAADFTLQASEQDLTVFPAKITSTPPGAELIVDGKKVGETPYAGNLPLGRHQMVLKKEGSNPLEKEISIEVNTPYEANYNLMTSPAGEFVNKGRDFLKKGQYNEAIEQLAEALKRNPEATELSQIHMLLGEAFLASKTYDQALAYYQRARENPEYATRADLGMAEAYAGLGQKDQALIRLVDSVFNSKDEKIRSQAGSLYAKLFPMRSVLYVATEPAGASIQVNGNPIGQVTPVILSDLMVGSYRVSIQKEGFKPFETRLSLPPSAIKPIIVKMEAQ